MKTLRISILATAIIAVASVQAQTSFDAGKLFETDLNGTSRFISMGGAMSALGNDISVISSNPAGIGTYHQSDVNVSFSLAGSKTGIASSPMVATSDIVKSELFGGMPNIGIVLAGGDGYGSGLNFAFSYRRIQNMDRTVSYYDAIYDADGFVAYRDFKDHQRNKIDQYDLNLSYNCNDVAYFGLTFGILSTDTWSEGYIFDRYEKGKHPDHPNGLSMLNADFMNSASGSGWNVSLGTIFRPIPALRLGVAFKSPTLFKQVLYYSDYLYDEAYFDDNGVLVEKHYDPSRFTTSVDYMLSSPWSLNWSAGLTLGHTALGMEYERHYTSRTAMKVNNTKMESQGSVDYRDYSVMGCGLEQNIGKISLRAGFNMTTPMYNDNAYTYLEDTGFNIDRKDYQSDLTERVRNFTCGLGYCSAPDDGAQFYIDFAFVHSNRMSGFALSPHDPLTEYNHATNRGQLTIGFCF